MAAVTVLPWESRGPDQQRFKSWLTVSLLSVAIAGALVPWLRVPELTREAQEALPPQLARMVLEQPRPVVPPPEAPLEQAPPEPVVPEPRPDRAAPVERSASVAEAREKAAVSGLLQFRDAFADMRETVDVARLEETVTVQRGGGEAAAIDRSVLTSPHGEGSSGVDLAALSRETGGVALSGRETTRVQAPEPGTVAAAPQPPRNAPHSRSIEDIRRIFDANKGAIFAIYNRALRSDPTLQGKVVLELVIAPSGQVTEVRVVASELADDALVAKILSRIRLFDFGQRDVGVTTISYPVHFLPS